MVGVSQEDQSRIAQDLQLHLIVDNYATQASESERVAGKTQTFPDALHPELQLVDEHGRAIFGTIRCICIWVFFSSMRELETSITAFLALRDAHPTRYVWSSKTNIF